MTLADTIARIQPYVAQIVCPDKGTGSGFVIDHIHGLVLTNAHVVGPYTTVIVQLNNQDYYGYVKPIRSNVSVLQLTGLNGFPLSQE